MTSRRNQGHWSSGSPLGLSSSLLPASGLPAPGCLYCGAIPASRSTPWTRRQSRTQIYSSPLQSVNLDLIAGSGSATRSTPAIRQQRRGLEPRPGRRKNPANFFALSRRKAGILSVVSVISAADCRLVCTGRVVASPPLEQWEGSPGNKLVQGVRFRRIAGPNLQADFVFRTPRMRRFFPAAVVGSAYAH